MTLSIAWFLALAALAGLGYATGHWLGRGPRRRAYLGFGLGALLVGFWTWLHHHPAVAIHVVPPMTLRYLEGTAAVPIFMMIVGIAHAQSHIPRQRRVAVLAAVLGIVYFFQGGLWMLQTTPTSVMGRTIDKFHGGVVYQTSEFSCVPAACATALNQLKLPTSEAQMAVFTETKAGTGATIIRAYNGLTKRLADEPYGVELVQPSYDDLVGQPLPVLTPLRMQATTHHMVTLLRIDEDGVWLADPQLGKVYMERDEFESVYTDQAIVFHHRR